MGRKQVLEPVFVRFLGLVEGRGFSRAIGVERAAFAAEVTSGSNSVVESQPSKLLVAGSIPVSRSRF